MSANALKSAALLAALLLTATAAHAGAMFRWIDENGVLTYSDSPPANPRAVKALTIVDELPPGAIAQKRSKEHSQSFEARANEERARVPGSETDATQSALVREPEPVRRRVWGATETVRDPCLRSSDPSCYEKNKDRYDPYLG